MKKAETVSFSFATIEQKYPRTATGSFAITSAANGKRAPQAAATAATGSGPLDQPQQAMAIGEPIPLIWCRRRGNVGGVLVFPRATEARFENSSSSITASYHCVLGDGPMGGIEVRDFRIGGCRRGAFSQNYNTRAGSWDPGNFATAQTAYQVPTFPGFTGGGGDYSGLSTLEFSSSVPGGSDDWNKGANVFVREGRTVERGRLLDAVVGPSDNIADLVLHAIERSSRVPAGLIDIPSFQAAALFTEANGLWFNGEIREPANLGDWLVRILPLFLLRRTKIHGKLGLRPLLPVNANGTINAGRLSANWLVDEASIVPGSFQQTYSNDSQAPNYQVNWRQQHDDLAPPIPRTLEVGQQTTGAPVESLDMSPFCTTELHAARAGHYQRACRYLRTHVATVKLRPGIQSRYAREGDIVQVKLRAETPRQVATINEWYEIVSIGRSLSGEEAWGLEHFPVDNQGRSLLALAVAEATVPGVILPSQQTASCDEFERVTDTSRPPSSSISSSPPFSAPTNPSNPGAGGQGGGFDRSETPDRSPTAQPPPDGGGTPAKPVGEGDNRCPLGYSRVDFGVNWAYRTGPVEFSSASASVIAAKGWPGVAINTVPTIDAIYETYDVYIDYIDSNDQPQRITAQYFLPRQPGYQPHLYEINISRHDCLGDPPNLDPWWYVRPGDTLTGLAERFYGNGNRWPDIYAANKDSIGPDPDLIFPGQVLRIPP
jgi:hypothetical protein